MPDSSSATRAPFISIKDASIRYQKAEITIRRFVRSVLEKEKAAERLMIHPLPQDAVKLKKMKKPFAYTISSDLLKKQFGEGNAAPQSHGSAQGSYVHLLEHTNRSFEQQLQVKDEQIRVLAQAIDGLSERQRETNVLMKGLQERFLLSAPKEDFVEGVVEEGNMVQKKAAHEKKPEKAKKPKKGSWWKVW
jgi:(2Fe-2S) ferredoxin